MIIESKIQKREDACTAKCNSCDKGPCKLKVTNDIITTHTLIDSSTLTAVGYNINRDSHYCDSIRSVHYSNFKPKDGELYFNALVKMYDDWKKTKDGRLCDMMRGAMEYAVKMKKGES
jgi:hypothetical protein